MKVAYNAIDLHTNNKIEVTVDEPSTCPRCKKSIKPIHLNSAVIYDYDDLNDNYSSYLEAYEDFAITGAMDSHLFCNSCNKSFLAEYIIDIICVSENFDYTSGTPIKLSPLTLDEKEFEPSIESLSPNFAKIYNQALAAETAGLDEIAGLGYRKSLEFLVKDFAILQKPECEEDIKKLFLSPCIKKYIDNPQIKALVERSTWIGNDEAHYIRKQVDRDVNDMKSFIKATVYFIGMFLIAVDAESMEPAK